MSGVVTWILHATALVATLACGLRAFGRLDAASRYYLWWGAMAAVLLLPTVHAISPEAAPAIGRLLVATAVSPDRASVPSGFALPDVVRLAMPWGAAAAAALVLWRLLVLQRSLTALRRLRRRCRPLPPTLEAELTGWLAARAQGRRARLLVSDEIQSPAVLGAGDPIIALPAWAVETLDAGTLDLLALHEHAHVERYDDRDLLVQASIEAVFAWHPVIWWIGRRLEDERERACDDRVVARTGRPARYAKCLLGVADHQQRHGELRLAPGIGRGRARLAQRVDRLLAGHVEDASHRHALAVAAGAALLVAGVVASAVVGPRVYVTEATWDRMATSSMPSVPAALTFRESAVPVLRAERAAASPTTMWLAPARETNVSTAPLPGSARPPSRPPDGRGIGSALPRPDSWLQARAQSVRTTAPAASEHAGAPAVDGDEVVAPATHPLAMPAAAPVESSFLLPVSATFQPSAPPPRPVESASPWKLTADAGESIGRGAAHAGVKTAGFFSRMGRAIASSF